MSSADVDSAAELFNNDATLQVAHFVGGNISPEYGKTLLDEPTFQARLWVPQRALTCFTLACSAAPLAEKSFVTPLRMASGSCNHRSSIIFCCEIFITRSSEFLPSCKLCAVYLLGKKLEGGGHPSEVEIGLHGAFGFR